ncbi:MAG: type I restriction enzyme HsdR N-terminal domain-containing protein [Mogibacterium sp.]|nr:type I restriction enzyme HsdR N-terminal domain-containing protein [Mogibacterium sp.]
MAVYQEKALARIKSGLTRMSSIVEKGKKDAYNEADTRKVVTDFLTRYLGWDQFDNITAEQMIGSRYADFVIKKGGDQLAVIEVKQIGMTLKDTHLNQARQYATDEGIEWIVLTNGDTWKVYRNVYEDKIPVAKLVFTVAISNKEEKPAEKAAKFYLISEEASRKHEIEDYFDRKIALSGENLADYILSDDVLSKIRIALKVGTGQKLSNYEVASSLVAHLFDEELVGAAIYKRLEKIKKSVK